MKNPLSFRRAAEADLDRIAEIHFASFPDDRGLEERRRNFTASLYGQLEDLTLAEYDGEIVGQAFLFPMKAWFGGRLVPVGGVASVSIAVEARGQGVASSLMNHLHIASDVRGDALTMLYAFREGFYARLGYGKTTLRKRLSFNPAAVPDTWRALAREHVKRARGSDREKLVSIYTRAAVRHTGWLVRSDLFWDRHVSRERRQFLLASEGYVAFEIRQPELHGETYAVVEELVAEDALTRLALLGALGALRDQVTAVVLEIADDDPLPHALVDADGRRFGDREVEHPLGTLVGGPMVRIDDVTRALEARGYHADGSFDLVVTDTDEDEHAMRVEVAGGRAHVSAARGAAGALQTSRRTLASLLYGGLRVTDALRLGLAFADPKVGARAERILAIAPMSPIDPF